MLGAKKNSWLQLLLPNWFAYCCDDYVDNYDYGYGLSCKKGLEGKEKQLVTDSYYLLANSSENVDNAAADDDG